MDWRAFLILSKTRDYERMQFDRRREDYKKTKERILKYSLQNQVYKVECIFQMVISSEFRVGQYRDDDHRGDAPHFISRISPVLSWLREFFSKYQFRKLIGLFLTKIDITSSKGNIKKVICSTPH